MAESDEDVPRHHELMRLPLMLRGIKVKSLNTTDSTQLLSPVIVD